MLRSILHQMLYAIPSSWDGCRPVYPVKRNPLSSDLDLDTLKLMFTRMINHMQLLQDEMIIYIFIDAMDESMEEGREAILQLLTSFCQSEQSNLTLRIFVASRPMVDIEIDFRDHLVIKLECQTEADIQHYVQSKTNEFSKDFTINQDLLQTAVVDNLVKDSKGVFLWVKLMILGLEKKARSGGYSPANMTKILCSLPMELEALYEQMLSKIVQATDAVQLFRWVAYSKRPLTVTEIQEVMAVMAVNQRISPITGIDLRRHRIINPIHVKRVDTRR